MSTSGSTNFLLTRDDIIRDAALLCNAVDREATLNPTLVTDFARTANMLIRTWRNAGMHLWKQKETTLFLAASQSRYDLSLSSSDHVAENSAYTKTTLSADEAASQTVLSVTSSTGMTAADKIGILLDDNTLHWTTIVSTGAGPVVTITTAIPSAAASGSEVYFYTNNIPRPLRVDSVRRYHIADNIEVPMDLLSRSDWADIPDKLQTGIPFRSWFDLQRTSGYLSISNVPSTIADFVRFTATLPIEDLDATTDNPDFPEEWYLALVYNIADVKKFGFNVPAARRREIENGAAKFLGMAAIEDREEVSVYFAPDLYGRGR